MRRLLYLLPLLCGLAIASGTTGSTSYQRLIEAVDSGNAAAMYRLSYMLETGYGGVTPDSARADSLLRAAARKGYAQACNMLGYRYYNVSPDSMLYWLQRAAEATPPDPKAFNNLGWLLSTGSAGVQRDIKKAIYWYERGVADSVPAAMSSMATLLLEGREIPTDTIRAERLLYAAARRGFSPAAQHLYLLRKPAFDTMPAPQLAAEAERYFRDGIFQVSAPLLMQASSPSMPRVLALLAQSYAHGWGVPYDYDHAMHLFWHAALAGDPSAAYIVGETMQQFPDTFTTEGTPDPHDRTADDWLRQAAAAGIPDAHAAISALTPRR